MGWHKLMKFPDDLYSTVDFVGEDGEAFPCSYAPPELRMTARIMVCVNIEECSS